MWPLPGPFGKFPRVVTSIQEVAAKSPPCGLSPVRRHSRYGGTPAQGNGDRTTRGVMGAAAGARSLCTTLSEAARVRDMKTKTEPSDTRSEPIEAPKHPSEIVKDSMPHVSNFVVMAIGAAVPVGFLLKVWARLTVDEKPYVGSACRVDRRTRFSYSLVRTPIRRLKTIEAAIKSTPSIDKLKLKIAKQKAKIVRLESESLARALHEALDSPDETGTRKIPSEQSRRILRRPHGALSRRSERVALLRGEAMAKRRYLRGMRIARCPPRCEQETKPATLLLPQQGVRRSAFSVTSGTIMEFTKLPLRKMASRVSPHGRE